MTVERISRTQTRFAGVRSLVTYASLSGGIAIAGLMVQQNFGPEQDVLLVSGPIFLVLFSLAVAVGRGYSTAIMTTFYDSAERIRNRDIVLLSAAVLIITAAIAVFCLNLFPNSADEYAYIIQAQTYARAKLWLTPPPLPEFFQFAQLYDKSGIWISPYQPGWPLLLTTLILVEAPPWLMSPVLGAVMVLAFGALARQITGAGATWLALLALVTSPFFLFQYASYFPHGAAALAAVIFGLAGMKYLESGKPLLAFAAGAAIGYVGLTRAFNAPIIAAPFVIAAALNPARRTGLFWFGLGGVPFLAALLLYNYAVTGNALTLVQEWVNPGNEPFGVPGHTATLEIARRIIRLHFWTSPVMLIGWMLSFILLARKRTLTFIDWIFPATLAAFTFYGGHGGPQYGPRYLFEAWPFSIITIARAIEYELQRPKERVLEWIAAIVLAHLSFQVGYMAPRWVRQHELTEDRMDVYTAVEKSGLKNIVVFVDGNRSPRIWTPGIDLTRNGIDPMKQAEIYVLDRGAENEQVMSLFPGRLYFIYSDGSLRPIARSTSLQNG